MIPACRLWEKTSAKGNRYLIGRLGGVRVMILANTRPEPGDSSTHTLMFDAAPASTRPKEIVYVWECLGQPGDYALCSDRQRRDFQTPNWKFRGELASVLDLHDIPQLGVDNRTVNGWSTVVHRDKYGTYTFDV